MEGWLVLRGKSHAFASNVRNVPGDQVSLCGGAVLPTDAILTIESVTANICGACARAVEAKIAKTERELNERDHR